MMNKESEGLLTLTLNGTPSMQTAATAILDFYKLLAGLRQEVAPRKSVTWKLQSVSEGSLRICAYGIPSRQSDQGAVISVYSEMNRIGQSLQIGTPIDNSLVVRRRIDKLLGLINSEVPSLRIETPTNDYDVLPVTTDAPQKWTHPIEDHALVAWGSVTGKIQVLSMVNHLTFSIYDLRDNRAIYCYLDPGSEHKMKKIWGRVATVKGLVRRDPISKKIVTVRRVDADSIRIHEDQNEFDLMSLIGAHPRRRGGSPLSSGELTRRIRDAE